MRKIITNETFWAVKTLLKGGASLKEAAEFFKLSYNTVSKLNVAESFEEYKHTVASYYAKSKANKAAAQVVVSHDNPAAPANEVQKEDPKKGHPMYMPYATQKDIMDKLREQNQLLREQNQLLKEQTEAYKVLSAKMVYIIEGLS